VGYQTLLVERADGIATITLNRPEARNALDLAMRREMLGVLDEIEADPTARVVILTGAGGHFCSGGDVKTMRTRHTAAEGRGRVELLNRLVLRLVSFPLPTIAMVDGYAVGAGSNLALCCDLIVASDRAKFGELFCKIGLAVDGGGTWLLPRVVGLARAKELVFTGRRITAARAVELGIKHIPQAVAQEVEPEHDDHDREPGGDREPGRPLHVGARDGDAGARREDRRRPAPRAQARQADAQPRGGDRPRRRA